MPGATDSANQARIKYYKYTDYIEKWDEIYQLFSKEAVLKALGTGWSRGIQWTAGGAGLCGG
jgi:phosphopantetheinyl transferase (holo-ACP synthase)